MTAIFSLAGKSALVTAAASGIGQAIAQLFRDHGARVIATDIDAGGLSTLEGCETRQLDACDPKAIDALAQQLTDIRILVNCVGYVHSGTILQCDEQAWQSSLHTNITPMYRLTRAFLPGMIAAAGGSIVNISSIAAIKGVPSRFAYMATKAAVVGLTKSVAVDFVTQGIRCNAICPGTIDTPSLHARMTATGDYSAARAAFIARQPLGRLGQPGEVAALALYLASDASAFVTGQLHVIDGGWTT